MILNKTLYYFMNLLGVNSSNANKKFIPFFEYGYIITPSLIIEGLGAILIVLFIIVYAIKKRRSK